jgi:hypothetical protein
MEVRPLQPWKALLPMLFTVLGIVVFLHPTINVLDDDSIIALQLLRESNLAFPSLTTIVDRLLQPQKALPPMFFTLYGIDMEVRLLQFSKA